MFKYSAALLTLLLFMFNPAGIEARAEEMRVQLNIERPVPAAPTTPAPVRPSKKPAPEPFKCEGPPLKLEVIPSFGHVERDVTLRSIDLTTSKAWGKAMVGHLAGTATITFQTAYKEEFDGYDVCFMQAETEVLYRLDTKIRSRNPYPADSCEYKQLKEHEELHIAAAKDFLKQTTPMLKDYILKTTETGLVTNRSDRLKAHVFVEQTMNNNLAEYAHYLNAEFIRTQAASLDTPEQMHKLFAQCPDWKAPEAE